MPTPTAEAADRPATTLAPVPVMRILHTIHAVIDLPAVRQRYFQALGAIAFAESYHAGEDRDMALLYVADHMVELMSPRRPGDADTTFARYLERYGQSLHSIELRVPDIEAAHRACEAAGVQLTTNYGDFFFIHPKSAGGVIIEVYAQGMGNDPQDREGWSGDWNRGHASGLRRLDHIAFVARDIGPALRLLTEVFAGRIVSDEDSAHPQPCRRIIIAIGDARVGLYAPTAEASGPLTDYLAGTVSGLYALVWQVDDPARARAWFERCGAPLAAGVASPEAFAIDPAFLAGARHEFTPSAAGA